MARQRGYRAGTRVDPKALAEFRAGIRKRYTDEQILDQLRDCAKALGRSPTMREFRRHEEPRSIRRPSSSASVAGTGRSAKRGSFRGASRRRRSFCSASGCSVTVSGACRRRRTSTSTVGSFLQVTLLAHVRLSDERAARGRVRRSRGRERLDRAIDQGVAMSRQLGRLPKFADWSRARRGPRPADGVADLQDVRRPTRRLGHVPVPRAGAFARERRRRRSRRHGARLTLTL